MQRIPRSHSSASLRSRSALALSCSARASLRYRIARAAAHGISNPNATRTRIQVQEKRFGSGPSAGALYDRRDRPASPFSPRTKPAPAAFLNSRRGRRFTSGTKYFKFGRNNSSWGFLVLSDRRFRSPQAKPPTGQHFTPMPGGRSQAASDARALRPFCLDTHWRASGGRELPGSGQPVDPGLISGLPRVVVQGHPAISRPEAPRRRDQTAHVTTHSLRRARSR